MNQGVRVAEGADGGVVILAAWCAKCSEEVGPDRSGCCPWCETQIVDEDSLPARELVVQARAGLRAAPTTNGGQMTATTVITAATCKVDGCHEPAVDRVGMYGKLCQAHKDEKRAARGLVATRSTRSASGLVGQAMQLVKLSREHDRAQAKLAKFPSATTAKIEFDEAVRRASMTPSPENLDRVQAATKALRAGAPQRTKVEAEAAQAMRALETAAQAFQRILSEAA